MRFSNLTSGSLSEKMRITATGNVGIGTTSPDSKFHVVADNSTIATFESIGSNANSKTFIVQSGGDRVIFDVKEASGGAAADLAFELGNSEVMRLADTGNVGIGTTSPGKRLDISHDGNSTNGIRVTNSDTGTSARASLTLTSDSATIDFYATSNAYNGVSGWNDAGIITTSSSCSNGLILNSQVGGIKFQDATSTIMVVSDGGNVGIGTTSPDSKLHVEDTNPEVRITGTGGTSFPRLLWEYPVSATQASRWALTASASGNTFYLYNYTQSKKAFQVDGTASHITLNHDAAGTTQIGTSTTQTAYQLYVATNVGQTGAIEAAGSVKITSGALGVNIAASATAGRIDASNDIVAYSTSDKRLKENIKPLENATEKVKKLTGVEFDWKQEHKDVHGYEGHDVGVIAQEVQEVLPEAIRTNDSGYLSVRYEKLIGLLIESNKELAARVEELEQKLKQ